MGFEPHSVAGSALMPASRLLLRVPASSHAPHERGAPLSKTPLVGSNPQERCAVFWSGRWDLNPRQLAWEARTLPLSYARSLRFVNALRFPLQLPYVQVLLGC